MDKLSVVFITYNEEHNIGRAIDAAKKVADEILVLDGFSTDRTRVICQNKGVRFEQTEWKGFGHNKNHANSMAENDWILSLDADEVLSDELQRSIIKAKEHLENALSFNRLANYCGKWIRYCGWYPDVKIRLFNRNDAQWNDALVHEELILKDHINVQHINGDLLHYTYNSINDHRERIQRYASLAADELVRQGRGALFLKMIFSPIWKFSKMYFFNLGFLDGSAGWTICRLSAYETRLKYRKAMTGK